LLLGFLVVTGVALKFKTSQWRRASGFFGAHDRAARSWFKEAKALTARHLRVSGWSVIEVVA
jgi:hypothetical protein